MYVPHQSLAVDEDRGRVGVHAIELRQLRGRVVTIGDARQQQRVGNVVAVAKAGDCLTRFGNGLELLEHQASCLLVSHDRNFVRAVGNRFWLIEKKKLVELEAPECFFATMGATAGAGAEKPRRRIRLGGARLRRPR